MGESAAGRAIQLNVETLEFLVEAPVDNFPWRAGEVQGAGKSVFLIHGPQTANDMPHPLAYNHQKMLRRQPHRRHPPKVTSRLPSPIHLESANYPDSGPSFPGLGSALM